MIGLGFKYITMCACNCKHTLMKKCFQQDWIEGESKKFDLLQKCSWLKGSGGGAGSVTGAARYFRTPSLQVSKSARLLTHRHLGNFLHPCLTLELHENRKISQFDHVRSWVWIHSTASKTFYLSTKSELTLFPNWRNRRPWKLCFLVHQRLFRKSLFWLVGCVFV